MEYPQSPNSHRERRIRTNSDLEQQKLDSRLLKEFGGACIWCYRSKKKCRPMNPCPPCKSNKRKCIRDHSQLCLSSPVPLNLLSHDDGISHPAVDAFFQQAKDIFHRLRREAFQSSPDVKVVVNMRQPDTEMVEIWVAEMPQLLMPPPSATEDLIDSLISKTLKCVDFAQLDEVEANFPGHRLIKSASAMARLFMALQSLSRTKVYVRANDVDPGRMAMFYILTAYTRTLCEMSRDFSEELVDVIRRKDSQDNDTGILSVWIAVGLYYRVLNSLQNFQPRAPIASVLDGIRSRLVDICTNVRSMLKSLPLGQTPDTRAHVNDALECHVPVIPRQQCFDVAFWLQTGDEFPTPTALHRLADPYSRTCYEMGSFLDDNFGHPTYLPGSGGSGSVSGSGSGSTDNSQSPSRPHEPLQVDDSDAISASQDSAQTLPPDEDMFDDLIDPFGTANWDSTTAIDSFYGHDS